MKNRLFSAFAVVVVAATVLSCKKETPPAPPTVDATQVKNEIQSMETAYADGMNARNPNDIAYYAQDATSYSQDKAPFEGKAAIIQNMKDEIAGLPKGAKVVYVTNEVFPSTDGLQVVELGSYHVSDSTGTKISTGNFIAMFEKRDGKYICVRDMGASDKLMDQK